MKNPGFLLFFLACLTGCKSSPSSGTEGDGASSPKISGEEISYTTDSVTMKGYLVKDQSLTDPRPGVLVVHEWWGHNDYARRRATMLAEMGYVAFAVDMYGDGKTADHPEDAGKFAGAVMANMSEARARFSQALEVLGNDSHCDATKIAAIGYCFGGGVVLNMALQGVDLNGVASFHGSLPTPDTVDGGGIKAALLVCHGADDPFIPAETVQTFQQKMQDAGVDLTFESYEGAVHSFTSPTADSLGKKFEMPLAYNAAADQASWQALETFLTRIFE